VGAGRVWSIGMSVERRMGVASLEEKLGEGRMTGLRIVAEIYDLVGR
jgi:hypothetical protein